MPKLILGAEVHRLVPKLFHAEVTRAEHQLPRKIHEKIGRSIIDNLSANPGPSMILQCVQTLDQM